MTAESTVLNLVAQKDANWAVKWVAQMVETLAEKWVGAKVE